jgi:hypothetical protein
MATRQRSPSAVVRHSLRQSALAGVVAYLAGYLLTVLFVFVDGIDFGGDASWVKIAGWVFYAAHTVKLRLTGAAGDSATTGTVSVFEWGSELTNLTDAVPEILYLAVPVIVLVGTAWNLVGRLPNGRASAGTAVALGASVVAGYLPLALLGQAFFSHTETGFGGAASITVGPDLLPTVLFVGIVYPVVCGAVGGIIAQQTGSDSSSRSRV